MISQPTPDATTPPLGGLEQEVLLLRSKLDNALGRIEHLEQSIAPAVSSRPLLSEDSPTMKQALALCAEVFPGSRTKQEVLTDPDDPDRAWRLITVYWRSSVREAIDQQSVWHNRFDALHPEAVHDISLFVVPE